MDRQKPRTLRSDLTSEQRERAEQIGDLSFSSHRWADMRVEKFIPSREQH